MLHRRSVLAGAVTSGALALGACAKAKSKKDVAAASAEMRVGQAFLARNAKAPGVVVLPSGLQYKIVHSGPATGLHPHRGDEVKVNYEGKLLNGQVFDSSYARGQPAAMPLDALIPGWIEALQLMRPGDEWMLYLPPELGYGPDGAGEIPPDATLIFRIELIAFLPGPGHVGQA